MKKIFYIIILLLVNVCVYSQIIPAPFIGNALYTGVVTRTSPTTFYIKQSGSDQLSGLSDANAWKTLTRINYESLLPGDTIRIKGGDTVLGSCILYNNSFLISSNRIRFNSYGTGKAILLLDSSLYQLFDIKYTSIIKFEFKNLKFLGRYNPVTELGGTSTSAAILIRNIDQTGLVAGDSNLVIIDSCEFTKFRQRAIFLNVWSYYKRGRYEFINNTFYNLGTASLQIQGIFYSTVNIRNNSFIDVYGRHDNVYGGGAVGISWCRNILIERNFVRNMGEYASIGSTGIYIGNGSNNIKVRYNEIRNVKRETGEGAGLYADCGSDSILFEYNYIQNCQGTGIQLGNASAPVCGPYPTFWGPTGYTDDSAYASFNIARFNIIKNDSSNGNGITIGNPYGMVYSKKLMAYNNLIYMKKGRRRSGDTSYLTPACIFLDGKHDSPYIYNNIFITDSAVALRQDSAYTSTGIETIKNLFMSRNIFYSINGGDSKMISVKKRTFNSNPFYWHYKYYSSLKNWADSTGYEKNGADYTYINYNPYVSNIRSAIYGDNGKYNPYNLDTLTNFKTLDCSFTRGNGVNYNSIVKGITDTAIVDFYGNALSSSNICIGPFQNSESYAYQIESLRWLGRDTAMSNSYRLTQNRRRLVDTAIVKNMKRDSIWEKREIIYMFAQEKEYMAKLNMKKDTGNATISWIQALNYTFTSNLGFSMNDSNYITTNVKLSDISIFSLTNAGADFYQLAEPNEAIYNVFGAGFDSVRQSYFSMNPENTNDFQININANDSIDDGSINDVFTGIGLFTLNRNGNIKEVYYNGEFVGSQTINSTFVPQVILTVFGSNINHSGTTQVEKFSTTPGAYFAIGSKLSPTQMIKNYNIIYNYLDYIGVY